MTRAIVSESCYLGIVLGSSENDGDQGSFRRKVIGNKVRYVVSCYRGIESCGS